MARAQFQRDVGVSTFTAESYELLEVNNTDPLPWATVETVTVTPPVGYIATLENITFGGLGGMVGAVNTNVFDIYIGASNEMRLMKLEQAAATVIQFVAWTFNATPSLMWPTTIDQMIASIRGQKFDSDTPLKLVFNYNGDITLTATRTYKVGYTLKKVAV
jgi:hypothetical protein